jgi:hypothetical protein
MPQVCRSRLLDTLGSNTLLFPMGLLEQRSERVRHGSSRDRQVQVLAQSFSRCDWRYSYGKGRLFRFSWFYL